MALTERQRVLAGLFLGIILVTLAVLWQVVGTVFFAITVAYVLYPVRRRLSERGVPGRVAAGLATTIGFLFVVALVAPVAFSLYVRRDAITSFLQSLPTEQSISVLGTTYVVDTSQYVQQAQDVTLSFAVDTARSAPVIGLKLFLFVFLIYAILLRPQRARAAALRVVPAEYHDVLLAFHVRIRDTLFALYILQAATSFGTFLVALVFFWALGYGAAFPLAVLAGILQFIPVIGPSILIAGLGTLEVVAGDLRTAVVVIVLGLVLVGFLPDAIIRPQLASLTTGMPASLYFVGFVGGTLTVGVMGVIAGPLVIALLVEAVELLTANRASEQQQLDDVAVTAPFKEAADPTEDEPPPD